MITVNLLDICTTVNSRAKVKRRSEYKLMTHCKRIRKSFACDLEIIQVKSRVSFHKTSYHSSRKIISLVNRLDFLDNLERFWGGLLHYKMRDREVDLNTHTMWSRQVDLL